MPLVNLQQAGRPEARWELDHLFIWTDEGAPEAEALISSGLTEGARNDHPGQGTSNRRFFFENAFIELIWVHDKAEAKSQTALHFLERWSGRKSGLCPFGFIFRPQGPEISEPPFDTWAYHPVYLPQNLSILVGKNADRLDEPMLFCMPFGRRPDSFVEGSRDFLTHKSGAREIREVLLVGPLPVEQSDVLSAAVRASLLNVRSSSQFALEIVTGCGERIDLRPDLPLIFV
jgi:hypothetical protein